MPLYFRTKHALKSDNGNKQSVSTKQKTVHNNKISRTNRYEKFKRNSNSQHSTYETL